MENIDDLASQVEFPGAGDNYRRAPSPSTRMPVRVRSLGRIAGQPYHSTYGTYHDDVMLTLVTGGRGRFLKEGKQRELVAGMVGLVFPSERGGAAAGLVMAEVDEPYEHFYCRFGGELAKGMASAAAATHGWPEGGFFKWEQAAEGASVFEKMISFGEFNQSLHPIDPAMLSPVEGLLLHLLALLGTSTADEGLKITQASLRQYLTDHLAEPTDLSKMADHFAVSKSHLCRAGKTALGTSVGTAAERMKLEWAQVLLDEPSLQVQEVAKRVGYADPLYFSRVFTRAVGVSPRRWRMERAPK